MGRQREAHIQAQSGASNWNIPTFGFCIQPIQRFYHILCSMNFSLLFLKGGETVSDIFQRRFAKYGDKNGELFHFQTSMLVSQYPKVLFDSFCYFRDQDDWKERNSC